VTDLGVAVLLGPTASGKSDLALRLARWWREQGQAVEIVNADAMLVYRGLDIGSAQPTPAERAEIPHHLIDILDLGETASVADFQRRARAAVADCQARGVLPLVVGGSALYLRAVTDRFDFPGHDPAVRARLEAELAAVGPAALHERLQAADPAAAAGILPANARRVVRALEAIETTGSFRSSLPDWTYALAGVRQLGLALDRPTLDARIAARVDAMWAAGLADEVRDLARRGLRDSRTAVKALGYAQALAYVDGCLGADEARAETVRLTRRFARRQLSWWRRDPRIAWLPAVPPPAAAAAAASLGWAASAGADATLTGA
jgi:tRNA dimethylallyltransferase